MDKIHVLNSYDVLVGTNILDQLTKIVASENYSKTFVITTSIVGDLHFKKVKEVLPNAEKILTAFVVLTVAVALISLIYVSKSLFFPNQYWPIALLNVGNL